MGTMLLGNGKPFRKSVTMNPAPAKFPARAPGGRDAGAFSATVNG
jgi:hypothetical protein